MSRWMLSLVGAAACGHGGHANAPHLVPAIEAQTWYRSPADCAQGPFEVVVPVEGSKYGEDVELRVHAPRRIEVHASVADTDREVAKIAGVFDGGGRRDGKADNARCVASAGERLAMVRASSGGSSGDVTSSSGGAPTMPPPEARVPELAIDREDVGESIDILRVRVQPGTRELHVKLWSIEPNDLAGVAFGVIRVRWAPNVSEAEYEAHLAAVAAEQQRRDEAWTREHARHDEPVQPTRVDPEALQRAEQHRLEDARRAEQRRRDDARRAEEDRERAALAAAIAEDRRRQRAAFCDAHRDDRECWGAGGFRVHAELDAHAQERTAYCAAHVEDARCWSEADWAHHRVAWDQRVRVAETGPAKPEGPPPAPLAEQIPPKLSAHAEWRSGYWEWTEATWVWLAGMWRVPDSDIVAEQTTKAPKPPPPLQVETPPPAPVRIAVWTPGFWQWSGTDWVWIAGSWQLRPDARASWRPAAWMPRGSVHVLVPGGWVHP